MPGNKRKKQRIDDSKTAAPLGSEPLSFSVDFEEKDDEERELESILFGKSSVASTSRSKAKGKEKSLDPGMEMGTTNLGLDHVLDEDVCFAPA